MIKTKQKTKPFATNIKFNDKEDIKNYNKLVKMKGRNSINDMVLVAIDQLVNLR